MRILVYPHQLAMGGSQINAIELAAAVRDRGHQVTITAPDGVLVPMIESLGLDYLPIPVATTYPDLRTILHLNRTVRRLGIDLVHAYEWRPSVEATFGPHLAFRTPVLMTVLSMRVPHFLPQHLGLLVGTRDLMREARGRKRIHLMEPPVDTEACRSSDVGRARERWSFDDDEIVVAIVCRLTPELQKLEGVLQAIRTIGALSHEQRLTFLIVGDGEGREEVDAEARAVNRRHGRELVRVAGAMMDPRDAYEAADIMLGMGSSALRAMAFGKPLIVQGTNGFWRLLDAGSLPVFLEQGWFGHGGRGEPDLAAALLSLVRDPVRRLALGRFGRQIVVERFGLDAAADRLVELYRETLAETPAASERRSSMLRSAAEVAKFRTLMGLRASRQALESWTG